MNLPAQSIVHITVVFKDHLALFLMGNPGGFLNFLFVGHWIKITLTSGRIERIFLTLVIISILPPSLVVCLIKSANNTE